MTNPAPAARLSALDVATGVQRLYGYPVPVPTADPQGLLLFPPAAPPPPVLRLRKTRPGNS